MADEESTSEATTKVQEVAANMQQAAIRRKRISGSRAAGKRGDTAEAVTRRYFEAIDGRDLDAAVALWAQGGRENVRGQVDVRAPEGVRAFIGELLDALPDLRFEIISTTTQEDRCAVHWRLTGTFAGPGKLAGIEPTRHPLQLEGIDLARIHREIPVE